MILTSKQLHLINDIFLKQKYICATNVSQEELLIALFRKEREQTPSLLEGDFAFVVEEDTDLFFCARDHLGMASFYYTFLEGDFLWDSSLTALLKQLSLPPEVDMQAMYEFAHHAAITSDKTMYTGIFRLPPGHYMWVKNHKATVTRYWEPASIKTDYSLSFEEAEQHFVSLFTKAVMSRIPENEAVACELSGGFDSSSILCSAHKNGVELLPFSMHFTDPSCNENRYINSVLKSTGLQGYGTNCDSIDYKETYNMEFNYRLTPHWPIWITYTMFAPMYKQIRAKGITTILTGQMGDQILWEDSEVIWEWLRRFKFRTFWKEFSYLPNKRNVLKNQLIQLLKPWQVRILKRLLGKEVEVKEKELLLPSDYRPYIEERSFSSEVQKSMIDTLTSSSYCMYIDSSVYKSMQEKYGISFQHPFADISLVEFMLSLPPEYKYSMGNSRHFHGHAMKGILPEEIINRREKGEFSVILLQQIEAIDRKELWNASSIVKLKLVKQTEIDNLEQMYQEQKLRGYDLQRYWRFINLEYWYNSNTFFQKL